MSFALQSPSPHTFLQMGPEAAYSPVWFPLYTTINVIMGSIENKMWLYSKLVYTSYILR